MSMYRSEKGLWDVWRDIGDLHYLAIIGAI